MRPDGEAAGRGAAEGERTRRDPDGASRAGITARYVAFVAFVLLLSVPVYIYVEPPWRALIARLAAAAVLGVVLLELRRVLARRVWPGGSALDDARRRYPPEPGVPEPFLARMDDVRAAARSRRYFEEVFWPRLAALTPDPPPRPAARTLHRGPSLRSLRNVITDIGRRGVEAPGGAAGGRGAAAPSSEATIQRGAAGRRGAAAPSSEATIR